MLYVIFLPQIANDQPQFDMTAWVKKGTKEVVGVITDFVDPK